MKSRCKLKTFETLSEITKNPSQACSSLSRRSFVSTITAGTGTILLHPQSLSAAGPKREKLTFIVISDTHIGYRDKTAAAQQWEKTAQEVQQAPGDLVLHLGDIVDGGREAQYPIYLESRKQIKKPIHEIPGNHDPVELFQKYIRKTVDVAIDHHWLIFLLIGNARTDSHDGFLTADQIKWIDQQCEDAGKNNKLVALCLHVPAHNNKHPDRGWYIKPSHGQAELYETIKRHQDRILTLMHGHFHNGIRGWEDHAPVHEILFPSVLYNLDRKLEQQKAPGYNLNEFRPGYTLVTIDQGAMKLQYKPTGVDQTTDRSCALPQLS